MVKMVVNIVGDKKSAAYAAALIVVKEMGHAVYDDSYFYSDITIAPLLTTKLDGEQLKESILGALIFHPSPLPYGRGSGSIRHAYSRREPITAGTWFWANERLDAGDICEMEIIKIDYNLRPRDFYLSHVIPTLERTLKRALSAIASGYHRRVPQIEDYSSFDKKME